MHIDEKAKSKLKDFWDLLFPFELEPDEAVRIVGLGDFNSTWLVKTADELIDTVAKKRNNYNLYITLATIKGEGGKETNMYRRSVIMLDFDKKDIEGLTDYKGAVQMIKDKYPSLFYHAINETGNGYHFYFAVEPTTEIRALSELNMTMARAVGADTNACKVTQIARLPCTKNLKNKDSIKYSNSIYNGVTSLKDGTHRRYKTKRLKHIFNDFPTPPELAPLQRIRTNSYLCCQRMLEGGAYQGSRNFVQGRITKYLQDILGLEKEEALQRILDWNKLCQPPKENEQEIIADFELYWSRGYNLLGCKCKDNPKLQEQLGRYCDRDACKKNISGEDSAIDEIKTKVLRLDNLYWSERNMKKLKGFDYLILSILTLQGDKMTTSEIKRSLTSQQTGKQCISNPTLINVLRKLTELGLIDCTGGNPKSYRITAVANYNRGYTRLAHTAGLLLINEIISQNEFLIYLYLTKSIQRGESMTYENISKHLGIDKSNVSRHIQKLQGLKILDVFEIRIPDTNHYYNRYRILI